MGQQVGFTRAALYQMVWERPVSVIARDIGVSDVALAKACRKAGIPLPCRGHWAIIKTGRTIKTPALPALEPGESETVSFSLHGNPPPKVTQPDIPAGPAIEVPTHLIKPHHLGAELRTAAKEAGEDNGVLALNYTKVLRVRTLASQLKRALLILDTLIKQFEKRGYPVRLSEKGAETELVLKEGVISFRLDERTRKTVPPPPPPRPPGRRGEHYYEPWRPAYILVGTGEFTLEFSRYALPGCRVNWKDGARRSLEAQLSDVIATIPLWEATLLAHRLEQEDYEARAREAEKQRISVARAHEVLRQQRGRLVGNLLAWERAERLRRFIAAFKDVGGRNPGTQTWLEWAHAQVEAIDPLSDLEAVTDLGVELSEYFTGRGSWEKPATDWWTTSIP